MSPRIFISHSSHDISAVGRVVKLIEAALVVESGGIRCTSLPGYKLSPGSRTSDTVRREIAQAKAFVAIITRKSSASAWVLFEMGARWGLDKRIVLLLGPGIQASVLRGPVREYSALSCSNRPELEQLLEELARLSDFHKRPPEEYDDALRSVLELEHELTGPENEARVLALLRKNKGTWLQPGAGVGKELGLDIKTVRKIADHLVDQGHVEPKLGQYGKIYRLSQEDSPDEQD